MKRVPLLASAVAIGLSACGGGSGGDPAIQPPPPGGTQTPLTVTTNNAKSAVRVAYNATSVSMETGDMIGGPGVVSAPGGLQKPAAPTGFPDFIDIVMQKIPITDVTGCGLDGTTGTQTTTIDFATPGTLTAGDTIVIAFDNCDQGLGEVLNGRMEMTVVTFSGDLLVTGLYQLEMEVQLVNFQVTTALDDILQNGDSTVTLDNTGMPMVSISISGNSLATVTNTSTQIITDFSTSQSIDTSVFPEPYTMDTSGTVDSTELGGMIDYTTPVTFQGAGDGYPFAGELLVVGANNASIRLVALDDVNVRIDTDTDGDNVVDNSETTTWDDIALQLP